MPYQHQIKTQKQKFKYRNRKIKKLKIYIRATFEKKNIQLESNEDATKTCFRCTRVKKKEREKALKCSVLAKCKQPFPA